MTEQVMTQPQEGDTRTEWGHQWRWTTADTRGGCGHIFEPHWRSTSGNIVRIFPPDPLAAEGQGEAGWCMFVCDKNGNPSERPEDHQNFDGPVAQEQVSRSPRPRRANRRLRIRVEFGPY